VTSLVADFGGKTRTLDRAQFGLEGGKLRAEAHRGGDPACPTSSSPQTDQTLVLANVARGAPGTKLTDQDGVAATFFDYEDALGLGPVTSAIDVAITLVAEDQASSPPAWAAWDVSLVFREGTIDGHVYLEHCTSLD